MGRTIVQLTRSVVLPIVNLVSATIPTACTARWRAHFDGGCGVGGLDSDVPRAVLRNPVEGTDDVSGAG